MYYIKQSEDLQGHLFIDSRFGWRMQIFQSIIISVHKIKH